jgi:hypothetical protein
VYEQFHPEVKLDFTLEEFKFCVPGAFNVSLGASKDLAGEHLWKFMILALDSDARSRNTKIVFYEQIVADPQGEFMFQLILLSVSKFRVQTRHSRYKIYLSK